MTQNRRATVMRGQRSRQRAQSKYGYSFACAAPTGPIMLEQSHGTRIKGTIMFDPAVMGTTNIGTRGLGAGSTGAHNQRNSQRRSLRQAFAKRIAGAMRAVADWIDPILPGHSSSGTQIEPHGAPPCAAVSCRT